MASGIENLRGDICRAERSEGSNTQADYNIIDSNSTQKLLWVMSSKGSGDIKKYIQNSNSDVTG